MIRRTLAALAAAVVLLVFAAASPASAATDTVEMVAFTFTLDPATAVQLLLSVALPILVGLVTTRITSSSAKAWLLAGLTVATSLLTELARALASGDVYDLGVALLAALPAFAISVATHYGLWKPTGTAERLKDLGRVAPAAYTDDI